MAQHGDLSPSSQGEPTGRVVPLRRRGALFRYPFRQPPSPVADLKKYERPETPQEYRHRMVVNGLGLAATALLIVVGLWIADTMAQMRKNQDCVLSGRRCCTPVEAPPAPRD